MVSSPTAPRKKGKRNIRLRAIGIFCAIGSPTIEYPSTPTETTMSSFPIFGYPPFHGQRHINMKRFHGSLSTGNALYRSSSSSAELLLCLALRLFGDIRWCLKHYRVNQIHARGEQSKFLENSMFHDTHRYHIVNIVNVSEPSNDVTLTCEQHWITRSLSTDLNNSWWITFFIFAQCTSPA